MQVLGLALSGTGAYDEAFQVFDEAARYGREYGIRNLLARAIAMSAGFHLDVFDYEGHETVAEEAREVARSVGFMPPLLSASIDLLLNLVRRGEVGRAMALERQLGDEIAHASAWHGWLWKLRFTQARAELGLAQGDPETAIRLADAALEQARGRRPKYEVLGLLTRGAGLADLGRSTAAIADAREAVRVARSVADPALFLRSASALLAIDGDDALATEASATAQRIWSRLPTPEMRDRFSAADAVRRLGRLITAGGNE
jgi:tetratricopeptide (TPR) repeat protein